MPKQDVIICDTLGVHIQESSVFHVISATGAYWLEDLASSSETAGWGFGLTLQRIPRERRNATAETLVAT
jgi:hypothetical protein